MVYHTLPNLIEEESVVNTKFPFKPALGTSAQYGDESINKEQQNEPEVPCEASQASYKQDLGTGAQVTDVLGVPEVIEEPHKEVKSSVETTNYSRYDENLRGASSYEDRVENWVNYSQNVMEKYRQTNFRTIDWVNHGFTTEEPASDDYPSELSPENVRKAVHRQSTPLDDEESEDEIRKPVNRHFSEDTLSASCIEADSDDSTEGENDPSPITPELRKLFKVERKRLRKAPKLPKYTSIQGSEISLKRKRSIDYIGISESAERFDRDYSNDIKPLRPIIVRPEPDFKYPSLELLVEGENFNSSNLKNAELFYINADSENYAPLDLSEVNIDGLFDEKYPVLSHIHGKYDYVSTENVVEMLRARADQLEEEANNLEPERVNFNSKNVKFSKFEQEKEKYREDAMSLVKSWEKKKQNKQLEFEQAKLEYLKKAGNADEVIAQEVADRDDADSWRPIDSFEGFQPAVHKKNKKRHLKKAMAEVGYQRPVDPVTAQQMQRDAERQKLEEAKINKEREEKLRAREAKIAKTRKNQVQENTTSENKGAKPQNEVKQQPKAASAKATAKKGKKTKSVWLHTKPSSSGVQPEVEVLSEPDKYGKEPRKFRKPAHCFPVKLEVENSTYDVYVMGQGEIRLVEESQMPTLNPHDDSLCPIAQTARSLAQ